MPTDEITRLRNRVTELETLLGMNKKKSKIDALNPRQRAFVVFYVLGEMTGAEAARRAGYSDAADGAKVRASNLLRNGQVCAAIDELVWKKFKENYVPRHALSRSEKANAQRKKTSERQRKAFLALRALEEVGIVIPNG